MSDLIIAAIKAERKRQHAQWGVQNLPNGTGSLEFRIQAERSKDFCDMQARLGRIDWTNVLNEEVAEVFAESDPAKIREELIQVAAVCVAWIECLDRKRSLR